MGIDTSKIEAVLLTDGKWYDVEPGTFSTNNELSKHIGGRNFGWTSQFGFDYVDSPDSPAQLLSGPISSICAVRSNSHAKR